MEFRTFFSTVSTRVSMDSLLSPPSPVAATDSSSNFSDFSSSIPSYDDVVCPRLEAAIASRGLDLVDVTVPVQCLVEDNSRYIKQYFVVPFQ